MFATAGEGLSVGRRIAVGAGVNSLAFAAVLGVSFLLTPHLIRELGKPTYDVWCVVEAVLAFFTLLDCGVAAGLVRVVARGVVTRDTASVNTYASASLVIFLGAGLVVLGVGTPVLLALSPRLTVPAPDAVPFMLVMLVNLAVTLPLSVFPATLDGLQCFTAKGAVRVGMLVVRTTATLGVLATHASLLPLAVVFLVTNLLEQACYAALSYAICPGLRLRPWAVDRATLRLVRGESWDAFLAMLAGRMTLQTGAIVIGLMLAPGAATFFATAVRLTEYAKQLLRQVTTTLTPGVSAMHARGDDAGIRTLLVTGTRWVLYAAVPVNLGLVLFSGPFLSRWVGVEFAAGSGPAALVLSGTVALGLAQSVAARVLYGLGHLRAFARAAMVEGVVNVALTALLVRPFGVEGVAVAVAVPNALFCLFVIGHTLRLLKQPLALYLRAWLRPLALTLIPLGVWSALGPPAADWGALTATVAAGLAPYLLVVAAVEYSSRTAGTPAGDPSTPHPETPREPTRFLALVRRAGRAAVRRHRPGAEAGRGLHAQ